MLSFYFTVFSYEHDSSDVLLDWALLSKTSVTYRNSLMSVEDKLRLLCYFPHPHGTVPSSCSHTALTAQAVQPCNSILMSKAAEIHSSIHTFRANQVFGSKIKYVLISYSQSFHVCILIHIPDLDWAVMRGTVQIMSSLPEWKSLWRNRIRFIGSPKSYAKLLKKHVELCATQRKKESIPTLGLCVL